jgi:hypothetical protein
VLTSVVTLNAALQSILTDVMNSQVRDVLCRTIALSLMCCCVRLQPAAQDAVDFIKLPLKRQFQEYYAEVCCCAGVARPCDRAVSVQITNPMCLDDMLKKTKAQVYTVRQPHAYTNADRVVASNSRRQGFSATWRSSSTTAHDSTLCLVAGALCTRCARAR